MADEKEPCPRPLPEPISDERLEAWKVQFQYCAGVMIGPILLSDFGAILARIARSESERDEARRSNCEACHEYEQLGYDERGTFWSKGPKTSREIAVEEYGTAEADRLFPPEVPK